MANLGLANNQSVFLASPALFKVYFDIVDLSAAKTYGALFVRHPSFV